MWIINAVLVHILLLGSIFVIYFMSPVLKGLQPQPQIPFNAPADRLVLIVTDGLRAESFFHANCVDIPHLRSIFHRGIVGVSRTRMPTESRPGHIALIAGMYEDPSAVMRGWKENPIDFDTVFNRSRRTYAWGANDVLHIFSRLDGAENQLFVDVYDTELDFSGRSKTLDLDNWVFERVVAVLLRKGHELRRSNKIIFFLHLLGLDSAGHIHKPGTPLFLENLHSTEEGIYKIFQQFEEIFPDNRTAYILTSDHGMTNSGSHGSGDTMETETPFFLWGAGIAFPSSSNGRVAATVKTFQTDESMNTLPLYELEQAQLAPLMSALLGLPPPMNNVGILPIHLMNATDEYKAYAAVSNAKQLLEQFRALANEHQKGFFTPILRQFNKLTLDRASGYEDNAHSDLQNGNYTKVIEASYAMMADALDGIDYYNRYYQNALLLSVTIGFIGWFYYLLQLLFRSSHNMDDIRMRPIYNNRHQSPKKFLYGLAMVIVGFILLQRVAFMTSVYLAFPIFVWSLVVREKPVLKFGMSSNTHIATAASLIEVMAFFLCVELLVLTFFNRRFIALAFLILVAINNWHVVRVPGGVDRRRRYVWLLLATVLLTIPFLPSPLGQQNFYWHILGIGMTFARFQCTKCHLRPRRMQIMPFVVLVNAGICAYQHEHQIGITLLSQCISWSYLPYIVLVISLHRTSFGDCGLKQRLEFIYYHLATFYTLFCTSYEAIFLMLLSTELLFSLEQQHQQKIYHQCMPHVGNNVGVITVAQLRSSMRIAFTILVYTLFTFFGVGNMASISSFDPNVIRCFLTTFSPFIIMLLIILKLVIPLVLVLIIIICITTKTRTMARTAMHTGASYNERQIFICLLLICDVMCLNFLFLVRNEGSWLDIGTSISHFIIMECTTLVLVLFTQAVKLLLRLY